MCSNASNKHALTSCDEKPTSGYWVYFLFFQVSDDNVGCWTLIEISQNVTTLFATTCDL
jgi:hypothetical protein